MRTGVRASSSPSLPPVATPLHLTISLILLDLLWQANLLDLLFLSMCCISSGFSIGSIKSLLLLMLFTGLGLGSLGV